MNTSDAINNNNNNNNHGDPNTQIIPNETVFRTHITPGEGSEIARGITKLAAEAVRKEAQSPLEGRTISWVKKGIAGLTVLAAAGVAGGYSAVAYGFKDAAAAGAGITIALLIVATIGLIYYAYSKYLESRQPFTGFTQKEIESFADLDVTSSITSPNSETFSETSNSASLFESSNDQEVSETRRTAVKTQRAISKHMAGINLNSSVAETIGQARIVETAMHTNRSKHFVTTNLKMLNNQIKALRSTFAEYAVKVGFSEAYRILDSEIAKDEKENELLYVNGEGHAGVNLRRLILTGKAKYENTQGLVNKPSFSEIEQGVLSNIQLKISHSIQNRFNELAVQNLDAAINRLNKDIERANNATDRQKKRLAKAGLESVVIVHKDSILKNLASIYKYSSDNKHFNRLVDGVVKDLVKQYQSNVDFDSKKEIEFITDALDGALPFNDGDRTINEFSKQVAQNYTSAINKLDAEEAEDELNRVKDLLSNELPELESVRVELQGKMIDTLSSINKKLHRILVQQATIHQMHAEAAAANHAGKAVEVDPRTTQTVVQMQEHQSQIEALKEEVLRLTNELKQNNSSIDAIKEEALTVSIKLSPSLQVLKQDAQIQALKKEIKSRQNEIHQFAEDSQAKKDLRARVDEIINGPASTYFQQAKNAAASKASSLKGAITSRLPSMPSFNPARLFLLGSKTGIDTLKLQTPATSKQEISAPKPPVSGQTVLNGRVLHSSIQIEEISDDGEMIVNDSIEESDEEMVINNSINDSDAETASYRTALGEVASKRSLKSILHTPSKAVTLVLPADGSDDEADYGFVSTSSEMSNA